MNESQEARRIAVIALIAALILAVANVIYIHRVHNEDDKIAAAVNRQFAFFDKRLEKLEQKVGQAGK